MAFDVCFIGTDPYLAAFERDNHAPDPRWQEIGVIGEGLGLSWGGPLGDKDRFRWDRPHFERRDWLAAVRAHGG